jgi:chromosome segregation ATPase
LLQKDIQSLREGLNMLKGIHAEIVRYVQSNKDANLAHCKAEIVTLEGRLKARKTELESVVSKIDLISKQQSDIQLTLRNISDNLTLRQFRSDQIENEAQIQELRNQIQGLNSASTRIESEYQILQQQKDELERERSHIVGKLQVLEDNIQLDKKKLSGDYKDVDKNFETAKYELIAKQLAVSDLEEYCIKLEE